MSCSLSAGRRGHDFSSLLISLLLCLTNLRRIIHLICFFKSQYLSSLTLSQWFSFISAHVFISFLLCLLDLFCFNFLSFYVVALPFSFAFSLSFMQAYKKQCPLPSPTSFEGRSQAAPHRTHDAQSQHFRLWGYVCSCQPLSKVTEAEVLDICYVQRN